MARATIQITGSGAVRYQAAPRITTMEIRPGKLVTIAPGQTTAISMSMTDGPRGFGGPWLLSEAGDYTAVIKIVLAVDGKQVELETDRVEFSVNAR